MTKITDAEDFAFQSPAIIAADISEGEKIAAIYKAETLVTASTSYREVAVQAESLAKAELASSLPGFDAVRWVNIANTGASIFSGLVEEVVTVPERLQLAIDLREYYIRSMSEG